MADQKINGDHSDLISPIPDSEDIFRRVSLSDYKDGELQDSAFILQPQHRGMMSCYRKDKTTAQEAIDADSHPKHKYNGCISFKTGEVRGILLLVEHAPLEPYKSNADIGHSIVHNDRKIRDDPLTYEQFSDEERYGLWDCANQEIFPSARG